MPSLLPSLLLVEDHAPLRATLRLWLSDLAAPIAECDNGTEVCASYAAHQPDWVLMDIELPGQDGLAATRQLLAKEPAARVLIVTTYDDDELRAAATAAGACGYVLKENLLEVRQWLQTPWPPATETETTNPTNLLTTERGANQ